MNRTPSHIGTLKVVVSARNVQTHNLDHGRQLTSRIKSWIHCDSLVESIVVMQALGEKGIPQWHWRSAPHSSRKNQNKQRKCAGYRRDFPPVSYTHLTLP